MEGWHQGMSSLPWTPLPPALPWHHGQGGVSLPPCPYTSTKPCRAPVPTGHGLLLLCSGHSSPWQFSISPLETSTFPLFPMPGKACEVLMDPAVLLFPEKTVTGRFNTPSKKHSPFFSSLPGKVTGAGIPPCMVPWQWLALLTPRMLPGSNPSLPAAPKGSKVSREAIHLLAAD